MESTFRVLFFLKRDKVKKLVCLHAKHIRCNFVCEKTGCVSPDEKSLQGQVSFGREMR